MTTAARVVADLPWRWSVQGRIFLIGGLGYMFDAWDVALNGFLTPLVGAEFALSTGERGLVATANLVGLAVGAVAWGTVADRFGRKRAFALTLLTFAAFSVLAALSPNIEVFLLLRFLAGIGLGGCIPVDYALVSEFSPRRERGRVLTAMDGWWPVGATLAGVASTLLLPLDGNWRWMLVVMILPALLLFWVRRGVPESPIYLARAGREEEARRVVDDLVTRTGAQPRPYVLGAVVTSAPAGRGPAVALDQLRRVWAFDARITSVAWALFSTVLLVYYTALTWMPSILRSEGFSDVASFTGATLMNAVGILGVVVSIVVVDRLGRKWTIGLSAPVATAALVVFAIVLQVPAAALVAIAVFGFGIQVAIPVLYAYVAELYPTGLRASGFGWASAVSRTLTGFVPLAVGGLLWPLLGLPLTFVSLGVLLLAAVAWMAVAAPDTTGRDLDEVADAGPSPRPVTDRS